MWLGFSIIEQGTDLIDLRRPLEGVIFGIYPFGGLGGRYGLRYGRIVSFLRKSFHSFLRLRTSVRKEEKEDNLPLLDLSASPQLKMAVDIVDKPFVLLADYDIDFDHDQP